MRLCKTYKNIPVTIRISNLLSRQSADQIIGTVRQIYLQPINKIQEWLSEFINPLFTAFEWYYTKYVMKSLLEREH